MTIFEAINQDTFDQILMELVRKDGVEVICSVPGVMDILMEEYNNAVLDEWVNRQPWEFITDEENGRATFKQDGFRLDFGVVCLERGTVKFSLYDLEWPDSDDIVPAFSMHECGVSHKFDVISLHTVVDVLKTVTWLEDCATTEKEWLSKRGQALTKVADDLRDSLGH